MRKTHRAVVVEAGAGFAGMGSEIAAFITEQAFDDLDAPVERVTGAYAPMPYATNLEQAKTPTKERIIEAVRRVCDGTGAADMAVTQGGDAEALARRWRPARSSSG